MEVNSLKRHILPFQGWECNIRWGNSFLRLSVFKERNRVQFALLQSGTPKPVALRAFSTPPILMTAVTLNGTFRYRRNQPHGPQPFVTWNLLSVRGCARGFFKLQPISLGSESFLLSYRRSRSGGSNQFASHHPQFLPTRPFTDIQETGLYIEDIERTADSPTRKKHRQTSASTSVCSKPDQFLCRLVSAQQL